MIAPLDWLYTHRGGLPMSPGEGKKLKTTREMTCPECRSEKVIARSRHGSGAFGGKLPAPTRRLSSARTAEKDSGTRDRPLERKNLLLNVNASAAYRSRREKALPRPWVSLAAVRLWPRRLEFQFASQQAGTPWTIKP